MTRTDTGAFGRAWWPAVAGAVASTSLAPAQTIDDLRQQVRDLAGSARLTAFVAGVVDLSENADVAAGRFTIAPGPDLDVDTWKLPWSRDLSSGDDRLGLRVEVGVGYFLARSAVEDVWGGQLPGLEAGLKTRWEGVSGYAGVGPRIELGHGLHFAPLAALSLSYLENEALWSGPGEPVSRLLFDGILFDWHATTLACGLATRLEHDVQLGPHAQLASLLRYDVRRFDGIDSTDSAQDFEDTIERVVVRSEIALPTGLELFAAPLQWHAHLGYSRYLGQSEDVLGFRDAFEVGMGLAAAAPPSLPVRTLRFDGAVVFGEDVRGWSAGLSVDF